MKKIIFALILTISAIAVNAQCPTIDFSVSQKMNFLGDSVYIHTKSITLPVSVPYGEPYIEYYFKTNTDYHSYVHFQRFDSLVNRNFGYLIGGTQLDQDGTDTFYISAQLVYLTYDTNGVEQVSAIFDACMVTDTFAVSRYSTGINEAPAPDLKTKVYAFNKTVTINSEHVIRNCEIYNMTGQMVDKRDVLSDGETKIETSLPVGCYVIVANLLNGGQTKTKVVIQ